MRNIVVLLFSIGLLSACGGGGGSDDFDGTTNARYDGEWSRGCIFDPDFNEGDIFTITIDGARATIDFASYPTSDCSGNASDTGEIVYSLDFVGTQSPSTGVCAIDDEVNTEIISARANGISIPSSQLNAIVANGLDQGGLPKFILLCVNPDGDTLYAFDETSGDGKTEATRPNKIDTTEFVGRQE